MIYYLRADDLTGEPGDVWEWSAGSYGLLKTWVLMYFFLVLNISHFGLL